jgi:hypothetical protein
LRGKGIENRGIRGGFVQRVEKSNVDVRKGAEMSGNGQKEGVL